MQVGSSVAVEASVNNWGHVLPGRDGLMRRLLYVLHYGKYRMKGLEACLILKISWPFPALTLTINFFQLCVYICVCSYCR